MIVHELKCVYIHIPKTAGVSLVHSMLTSILGYETAGEIGYLPNNLKCQFELRGKQKHKLARYFVPEDISRGLWNSYYKFTVVRNPWDRVVSEFHWRHSLSHRKPSSDFKEFILYCKKRIDDKTNKANDIYWTHAQTQKSFITDHDNNIILDDIFRFENITEDVNTIGVKLGITMKLHLYNTSKHTNYKDYYNTETKQMIESLYKEDIEEFSYEF